MAQEPRCKSRPHTARTSAIPGAGATPPLASPIYVPYPGRRRQYLYMKFLRCWPLALLLLTGCANILSTGESPEREVGQFDPGLNGLPEAKTIKQLCGDSVIDSLYTLSDTQAAISYSWQKFQVHASGAVEDGVTPEEKESSRLRRETIRLNVLEYKEAMAYFREVAADVYGPDSAECEQRVLLVVETIYQNYENTIYVLEKQADSILESL